MAASPPTRRPSSLEIAQGAALQPIGRVAAELGLLDEEYEPYGRHKAKVDLGVLDRLASRPDGKLVCVTSITPTRSGEGKTTTAVALTQGLARAGARPVLCLREPSLGPVFGVKGGAAGGGYAQVVPMEDLNLHFTGDIHAIGAANNLLAAMIDAHLLHGNELGIDPLSITWKRCLDMNDRALRRVVSGLGGRVNGSPRETGFDITAASEVMAIVAVSRDLHDLRSRLGAITVGETPDGELVTADDIGAAGSMAVLLKDAIKPNLVQTLEGQPAFVHAGPFANIASGNNSLIADRIALKLGDIVVTEGGFGSDMGFEKFVHLVARRGGIAPSAVVLVATPATMHLHGPENIRRHIGIVRALGFDPVVAINVHPGDDGALVEDALAAAESAGARAAVVSDGFERGGKGALDLAAEVLRALEQPGSMQTLYPIDAPIEQKLLAVAKTVYGAADVALSPAAKVQAERLAEQGLHDLPVCMAKTQLSLGHDLALGASPSDFTLPVRDLRAYTGAGWVVALCGDMQTMPGLSAAPAALAIDVDGRGRTVGLF